MTGCLTLKKAAKIEVISRHVRSQSLNASEHNILGHEVGEMVDENDSSDDDMDEVSSVERGFLAHFDKVQFMIRAL